jgi:hypothetical protein
MARPLNSVTLLFKEKLKVFLSLVILMTVSIVINSVSARMINECGAFGGIKNWQGKP